MHTYWLEYDIKFDAKSHVIHLSDMISTDYEMGAGDLQARVSQQWALVSGDLNDITNFVVVRHVDGVDC